MCTSRRRSRWVVREPCEPHHDSTVRAMLASYQGKKDGELTPKPTGLAKASSLVRPIKIAPGHLPSAQAQLEPSVQWPWCKVIPFGDWKQTLFDLWMWNVSAEGAGPLVTFSLPAAAPGSVPALGSPPRFHSTDQTKETLVWRGNSATAFLQHVHSPYTAPAFVILVSCFTFFLLLSPSQSVPRTRCVPPLLFEEYEANST